ncbi:hypothetical protein ACLB2K_045781 [Fragaria x ananassa]
MAEALINLLLEQLVTVAFDHTKEAVKLILNAETEVQKFSSNLKAIQAPLEDAENLSDFYLEGEWWQHCVADRCCFDEEASSASLRGVSRLGLAEARSGGWDDWENTAAADYPAVKPRSAANRGGRMEAASQG